MRRITLFSVIMLLVLLGCTAKVQRQNGMLNLEHELSAPKQQTKDVLIAIVSPEMKRLEENKNQQSQDSLRALIHKVAKNNSQSNQVNFSAMYSEKYYGNLRKSLQTGIEGIVINRGFNILGPFDSYDEMTFGAKEKSYLSVIPRLNLDIQHKVTYSDTNTITNIYREKGIIQLNGDVVLEFVEPLTKEKIMQKRINLSDLDVKRDYIREYQWDVTLDIFDMLGAIFAFNSVVKDNTDEALTEAINEFYSKAMSKFDTYISSEEILSYKDQVDKLKGIKRY